MRMTPSISPPRSLADAPRDAGIAESVVAVDFAAALSRPVVGIALLAAWIGAGIAIALVLSRRGHDTVPALVLGVLAGPLLAGLAKRNLIPSEAAVPPIVLEPGEEKDGDHDVLVAVCDGPPLEEAIATLHSLGDRVRRVTLVRPIAFEVAADTDEAARSLRSDAENALRRVAARVPGPAPRLVLLPGAARQAERYAELEGIDLVLRASDPSSRRKSRPR